MSWAGSGRTVLEDSMKGSWDVLTGLSAYVLDLDKREVVRHPGQRASAARTDGQWMPLASVVECRVGEPLCFVFRGGDGLTRPWRSNSAVARVTRAAVGLSGE